MMSDQKIIEGCIKGKRKAHNMLYKKFAPMMLGICIRYAKDRAEAEDVLQDGFIKVFSNINRFRMEGSFEGWIKRIMVNTSIDHFHKQQAKDSLSSFEDIDLISEPGYNDHRDTKYDDIDLSHDTLLRIIRNLPAGYRMVFNLFAIEHYSHKEIAEALGISISTSKTQLSKARKNIQKKISLMKNESTNNITQ